MAAHARNEHGMTLIETLVAVVIFSIAVVFLSQMLFSGRVQVEVEGERRIGLKMAEYKIEELRHAGYYYSDVPDSNWTSLSMAVGQHPVDPTVVLDNRGTDAVIDDLIGNMVWTVRDTSWVSDGVTTECKSVKVEVEWPQSSPRDEVSIITMVGK